MTIENIKQELIVLELLHKSYLCGLNELHQKYECISGDDIMPKLRSGLILAGEMMDGNLTFIERTRELLEEINNKLKGMEN